jgi:hypothetical protein
LLVPDGERPSIKFDFQLEFDHNGNVIPQPSFDEYTLHITNLYDSIKKVVSSEKIVEEFLLDITTIMKDELHKTSGFVLSPIDFIKRHSFSKSEKSSLEKSLYQNTKKCLEYLYPFRSFSPFASLASSPLPTTRCHQYTHFQQLLKKLSHFHTSIEQLPNYSVSINSVMLNMMSFKQTVASLPAQCLNDIYKTMVEFLTQETQSLHSTLEGYLTAFSSEREDLASFIEKSTKHKELQKDYPTLTKRVENLEAVAGLIDQSALQNTSTGWSTSVGEGIDEVRRCMELLPDLFIKVKKDIEQGREDMADKVIGTSKELQKMMDAFEEAYVDNFHRRGSTKKPKDVLTSVQGERQDVR